MKSRKSTTKDQIRVGADIGGTFTDLVMLRSDGNYSVQKVPSTVEDFSRGIVEGLDAFLSDNKLNSDLISEIIHGTTVATNAILENQGARTALVTTRGFRDVLEFRRLRFPDLFSLDYTPPKPLVQRRHRFEVIERIMPDGSVRQPLDDVSVESVLDKLEQLQPEAIAICLLHSYANPIHERKVVEAVKNRFPNLYVSGSIDVLPEIREYERTSTTVINSYIGPIVDNYLESMQKRLDHANMAVPISIMQSNGGVMSYAAARRSPARIIESGPAAGVVEAIRLADRIGLKDVITFDMGGTTAKASLIEQGKPSLTTEYEVGAGIQLSNRLVKGRGHALKLPVIDIAEVGAGGGSIVRVDPGGSLRVGPQSAGAKPGPACYSQGGTEATVTDANVVLGYINPTSIAGGTVSVNSEAAKVALNRSAAEHLKLETNDAAYGVYAVANTTMIRAIKSVTTYRGRDPREFTLMAFGGSGPLHAAEMARSLGIRQIIVPASPGVFSALGLLEALPEYGFSRTMITDPINEGGDKIINAFNELESSSIERLRSEDLGQDVIGSWSRTADLRYRGQAYELTVNANARPDDDLANFIVERFHIEHERTYGRRASDEPVDLVTIRSTYRIDSDRIVPKSVNESEDKKPPRNAYFGKQHGWMLTPVIDRGRLTTSVTSGPLIIEEYDSTTLVPPDTSVHIDQTGNIIMINTDLEVKLD
ncbi:MAG: hydantoinase/oxoprolinase family protein [Dehalococcoidia bacterium]|nr:hydantoinase/oxoprolinase family protein [Dehalococcoidia bacterium]